MPGIHGWIPAALLVHAITSVATIALARHTRWCRRITFGGSALASAMTTEYIGIHGFFGAFLFGAIGVREFTDAVVADPAVTALRARVAVRAGADIGKDSARVGVTLKNGTRHQRHVAHAKGSIERPMTDAELEQKFEALAEWGHCNADPATLMSLLWSLDTVPDAAAVVRMTARA